MTIRPRDPEIVGPTLAFAPYSSAEACRRLLQLAYRDCADILDITYGDGGFWDATARPTLPPGVTISTNNPDEAALTDFHADFTDTGLDGKLFDLVVYDPPHVADGGADGIMATRYGTARGTSGLRWMIEAGFRESCRLARVGVLVKVADHAHGGEWLSLSDWIKTAQVEYATRHLYCVMHTYRPTFMNDPKWKVQRVPRSNGATYLAFRFDSGKHRDWDREYERQ